MTDIDKILIHVTLAEKGYRKRHGRSETERIRKMLPREQKQILGGRLTSHHGRKTHASTEYCGHAGKPNLTP